ncbi:MAG: hypothetical protein K8S55_07245 [Phycisphaerae bacterium]|nr:hypothetical protein [Phycisphaerae bacterium]
MRKIKISQLLTITAYVLVVANIWLFSPLSSMKMLGTVGLLVLFVLNPIAVIVAGQRAGYRKAWVSNSLFVALLLGGLYAGPELLGIALGVPPIASPWDLGWGYPAALVGLYGTWILLGAMLRRKTLMTVQKCIHEAAARAAQKQRDEQPEQ